jgi:hypothetical protein
MLSNPRVRNKIVWSRFVVFTLLLWAVPVMLSAQNTPTTVQRQTKFTSKISTKPFAHWAVGVQVGTLGPGLEVAATLSRRANLRVDGYFMNYSRSFNVDGINYDASMQLRHARASLDYYPFGGFRLSGGVAAYNKFNIGATATVPAGQTVSLDGATYYSSATDPLHGSANLSYPDKYAGVATIGFGNPIPRNGRRWSFPTEIGVIFTTEPNFVLNMAGSACATSDPTTCLPVTSYPGFQTSLTNERNKINRDLQWFKFYPIFSTGFSFRF